MSATAVTVTLTATKGVHVAVPGRYAHVAVRPVTDYEATVDGKLFANRNKAEIQSAIRRHLRRNGHEGRVIFVVQETAR